MSMGTNRRNFASATDIRAAFHKHRAELEWLAFFITGDAAVAAACVKDACAVSESHNSVFEEWLSAWARYATIRSAIQTQQALIERASANYFRIACVHGCHAPLSTELLEFLVEESDIVFERLDVVSRIALVVCGVEGKSVADAALMLAITRPCAQAAYCAALDCLEVIRCELIAHENGCQVMWN